jgi:hypothetical protein
MRKLAYIQTIKNLEPIEGADQIEKATILGWNVVVKKGEFSIGDKCVYIEIDSKLKEKETFEFLRSRKFRIKIIKLKGVISYGIVFPLSILEKDGVLEDGWTYLPEISGVEHSGLITSNLMNVRIEDDADLTDILGVEKYDLEEGESLQAAEKFKLNPKKSKIGNKIAYWKWKIKTWFKQFDKKSKGGRFPSHLCPKTDETRIQAYSQTALESLKGKSFTITTKMDGSSLTVIKHKKTVIVCSRNMALGENNQDKFWGAVYKYDLKRKVKSLGRNIALQMELVGEGIQGNRYNIKGQEVRLFNVYDIDKKTYLSPKEMIVIAKKLEIPHVNVVNENFIFNHTVDELVAMATVKSVENEKVDEEGYVFKLNDDESKLSFKVINPNYLLEKEKHRG